MKMLIGFFGALALTVIAAPPVAAADLTTERLIERCRPQMEATIPGSITFLEAQVAEWQLALKETPEDKDRGEQIIREDQQKIASLRADGIQGAAMRDMIDPFRQAGSKNSKAELRKALSEARHAPGPDASLAACILDAVLANLEGTSQSASAAAVAARSKTAIPPLRPTAVLEAHNPAGEATDCVRVIYKSDFKAEHVSSIMKAAFRNTCSRPVEVIWCTQTGDCKPGYTNLGTLLARKDRGFSYEPSVRGSKVAYAACYNGFVPHQGELSKKLNHACK